MNIGEMFDKANAWPMISSDRIERLLMQAENKSEITVAFLGGSITEGYTTTQHENSYAFQVMSWWKEKFPNNKINYLNAGIAATHSYLGLHRVERDILCKNPDFIVIEFAVNDSNTIFFKEYYEELIKKVWYHDCTPAVLLLFVTMEDGTSAQEMHSSIGLKYKIPMLSYRNVIMDKLAMKQLEWKDISPDDIHPNDVGHKIIADLIKHYLNLCKNNVDAMLDDQKRKHEVISAENYPEKFNAELFQEHPHLKNGWYMNAQNTTMKFHLTFLELGMTYYRSILETYGGCEVWVDGKYVDIVDAYFPNGWGSYGESLFLYKAEKFEEHEVVVKLSDTSKEFGILAWLIS